MQFQFAKAVKERAKLRLAFIAPAGGGKTFTALTVAARLAACAPANESKRVAVIDTEHGSAAKYADLFDFDELQLTDFSPDTYVAAIRAAESAGYGVIVIDSLSHAWAGPGGALELVDEIKAKTRSGASYHGWREVTPKHHALVEAMLQSPCHIIGTMRSKMTHVVEDGKVKKLGLQPVQRDGLEYEFDVTADLEDVGRANRLTVSKTRCSPLRGRSFDNPGNDFADVLIEWLKGADPHRPKIVTPDQLATIQIRMPAWCRTSGIDPDRQKDKAIDAWQAHLRTNYGVATARNLTQEQAADLIAKLPEPAAEKPTEPPAAAAPQPEAEPPPPAEAGKTTDGPVTEAQLADVKRLMPVWVAVHGPQPPADQGEQLRAWRDFLKAKWGVISATRMTAAQAEELLGILRECEKSPTAAVFAPPTAGTASADQQQPQPTPTAA